ncbi:hypothetical protein GF325_01495 [Candidatus Bathyarchaeota archaeon]|nr:hypothetical protein [Candidatus Bathyarchaeota archaeon]
MAPTYSIKSKIYIKTLKAYYLALAGCNGCLPPLKRALNHLPITLVREPHEADIIFVTGLLTKASIDFCKRLFKGLVQPYSVIRIGTCLAETAPGFLKPETNSALAARMDKFFPIEMEIKGCPPSAKDIIDRLETFLAYFDITPEITKMIEKRLDRQVFDE